MKVELTRFKVKSGKSGLVDEWMKMLQDNLPAAIETLEGEKMYVEAIFRENKDGQDYLYWFIVQGEDGINVNDSEHEIDKKHNQYFRECVDPSDPDFMKDMDLQLFLKAKKLDFEAL